MDAQSCPTLCNPMDQAPLSMGFSRREYWSGLPFPTPGNLPDPEIELASPGSPALAGGFFTTIITQTLSQISCGSLFLALIFGGQSFLIYLLLHERKIVVRIKQKKVIVRKWSAKVKDDFCYCFSVWFVPLCGGWGGGRTTSYKQNKTQNKESYVGSNFQMRSLTE